MNNLVQTYAILQLVWIILTATLAAGTPLESRERSNKEVTRYPNWNPYPERRPVSGYNVVFDNPNYSVSRHLDKIEEKLDRDDYIPKTTKLPLVGYYVPTLSKRQIKAIFTDRHVKSIEENFYSSYADVFDDTESLGNSTSSAELNDGKELRARQNENQNVGWGLAYLSARRPFSRPGQEPSSFDDRYHFKSDGGKGVDAYIVDSGVNHISEFENRFYEEFHPPGVDTRDRTNHGTRVASCLGSRHLGAAKRPNIRNCKVEGRNGVPEAHLIIQALGQIIQADQRRRSRPGYKGAVINMSLGTPDSVALKTAINQAWDEGIAVVTAAMNAGVDARSTYPCAYRRMTICVGATNNAYQRAIFSNYGDHVSIMAPGHNVQSYNNDGSRTMVWGTSFAAPYVSGIISTFFSVEGPGLRLDRVKNLLTGQNGERGALDRNTLGPGTPNLLANNGYQKSPPNLPYVDANPPQQGNRGHRATQGGNTATVAATATGPVFPTSAKNGSSPCTEQYPPGQTAGGLGAATGALGTGNLQCGAGTAFAHPTGTFPMSNGAPPTANAPSTTNLPSNTDALGPATDA